MFMYAMRPGAVAGEEADGVVREEGVEGDGEVAGSEEDERPVEGETPDCGGVVEVDAACGAEEVGEVERTENVESLPCRVWCDWSLLVMMCHS